MVRPVLIIPGSGDVYVPLANSDAYAVTDLEQLHHVKGYNWRLLGGQGYTPGGKPRYAARNRLKRDPPGTPLIVYMHRAICKPAPGEDVDHDDCDTLNNRRSNLAAVTHTENVKLTRERREHRRAA